MAKNFLFSRLSDKWAAMTYTISDKEFKLLLGNGYQVVSEFAVPAQSDPGIASESTGRGKDALIDRACALIRAAGADGFEREVKFHPKRKWRLDIAWPEIKLGVEIHGGMWGNGRHNRAKGFMGDREKMNTAQLMGWIVLEFGTAQVNEEMGKIIASALDKRSR